MRKADLFVMSSLWEGPGHVLIEAQGVGTIVVTTDCPSGPRESLLDGRLGKIVPVGDHEAMAEAIAESLANRERSDQIAIDGLAHSERYRPASVANSWSDLIESL
jgi:glycosyltransferase involved in cell wall biosynthesis